MPSCRPCSSTMRKFINRCGCSCSSLKSLRCTASCVRSRTAFSSASSSAPCAKGVLGDELVGIGRQRHQPRARPLVQRLQQRQHLVLQHAGHQPFAALFADLVERIDRHGDGDAVLRVAGFVQVAGLAVDAAQAQRLREGRGRDAGRLVAHQLVARQHQQPRLALHLVAVPALQARAASTRRAAAAGRRRRRSVRRRPARPAGATCAPAPPPARSACGCAARKGSFVSHSPPTSASRMKISRAAAGSTLPKFTRRLL